MPPRESTQNGLFVLTPEIVVLHPPHVEPNDNAIDRVAVPAFPETLPWCGRGIRPQRRWSGTSLRRTWMQACDTVGFKVGLYVGAKHTFATDAAARGVPERALQVFLGHADVRSARRYARMGSEALLEVLRPVRGADGARERRKRTSNPMVLVVEAAGIEPASDWFN